MFYYKYPLKRYKELFRGVNRYRDMKDSKEIYNHFSEDELQGLKNLLLSGSEPNLELCEMLLKQRGFKVRQLLETDVMYFKTLYIYFSLMTEIELSIVDINTKHIKLLVLIDFIGYNHLIFDQIRPLHGKFFKTFNELLSIIYKIYLGEITWKT